MLSKVKIGGRWHYLTFFEGKKGEKKEQVLERWVHRNPRKQRIAWKATVVAGVVNVLLEYVYKKTLPS